MLLAWLRNRYQLLFPFALDLHRLDAGAGRASRSRHDCRRGGGRFPGRQERERIEGALSLVDRCDDERAFLDAALAQPKSLNELLREIRDVRTGALVYAASLMAVDQRKPVNRHYLRYLAARLQLSEELVGSLEQRFRSSG